MDLGKLKELVDNPWLRRVSRVMIAVGVPAVVGIVSAFGASIYGQITTVRDAQSVTFSRLVKLETSDSAIQSTLHERAVDNDKFQDQVLATLETIKGNIVAIRISEAGMQTLLREHFPNVGMRSSDAAPAVAAQPFSP